MPHPVFLQLGYALKQGIPYLVIFGKTELKKGVVKIKDLDANTEEVVPEVSTMGSQVSCCFGIVHYGHGLLQHVWYASANCSVTW